MNDVMARLKRLQAYMASKRGVPLWILYSVAGTEKTGTVDDNPVMLRFVAKYAKEAADDMDSTQAKERGALYHLAQVCSQGQGRTMRAWDDLSRIADYCSGQSRARRDTPAHTVSMGQRWEQLSGEAVNNF